MSNNDAITRAQIALIVQAELDDNYPIEKHLEDAELIADLTELKLKRNTKARERNDLRKTFETCQEDAPLDFLELL